MTYDPNTERREPPPRVEREVVHTGGSNAGWWVAAIVAIVAVVGLFFLFSNNRVDDTDLEMARQTGAAQEAIANAAARAQDAAAEAAAAPPILFDPKMIPSDTVPPEAAQQHPAAPGFFLAFGVSGHGLMIAPAVGKVLSELIRTGRAEPVDVRCFDPGRFDRGELVHDEAMI